MAIWKLKIAIWKLKLAIWKVKNEVKNSLLVLKPKMINNDKKKTNFGPRIFQNDSPKFWAKFFMWP